MDTPSLVSLKSVDLRRHPVLNERWVQKQIAENPSILGLGDLVLRDKERSQPSAGRLDLLLQDSDSGRRYEVEIQLGTSDESHIIRTIEYWDIERKRYPQYDHCAVIVAENITARYLNVISLFNGHIPLIAIQMRAYGIGDQIALIFTKVLDELKLGLEEEDELEIVDRAYWMNQASPATIQLTDDLHALIQEFEPSITLKYNKFYIGLEQNGHTNNFVVFRTKKKHVRVEPRLPRSDELDEQLEQSGLDLMDYDARWGRYRIRMLPGEFAANKDVLQSLFKQAHELA